VNTVVLTEHGGGATRLRPEGDQPLDGGGLLPGGLVQLAGEVRIEALVPVEVAEPLQDSRAHRQGDRMLAYRFRMGLRTGVGLAAARFFAACIRFLASFALSLPAFIRAAVSSRTCIR
jgi:hypothetical protein